MEKYSFNVQTKTHNATYLQFPIAEVGKILQNQDLHSEILAFIETR